MMILIALLLTPQDFEETLKAKGGVEWEFRLSAPGKDDSLARDVCTVLKTRLELAGHKHLRVEVLDRDRIRVRVAGLSRDNAPNALVLAVAGGKLEFRSAAPKDVQEKWNKQVEPNKPPPTPPPGYMAFINEEKMVGEYDAFGGDYILVEERPVVTGQDLKDATAEFGMARGGSWMVALRFNPAGAKAWDAAAEILFNRQPKGLVCIMIDGFIISKPVVNSAKFDGQAEVVGRFDETGAKNLAIILKSGSLPTAIGRKGEKGGFEPGQPETERFLEPGKK